MKPLRMPITVASRKGVSGLISDAANQRVLLTSHGRPVAAVDSAERLDEDIRLLRETRLAVLDAAADLISQRSEKFNLDQVCSRLGVNADQIRLQAAKHGEQAP
jgi:hypothetical protein